MILQKISVVIFSLLFNLAFAYVAFIYSVVEVDAFSSAGLLIWNIIAALLLILSLISTFVLAFSNTKRLGMFLILYFLPTIIAIWAFADGNTFMGTIHLFFGKY